MNWKLILKLLREKKAEDLTEDEKKELKECEAKEKEEKEANKPVTLDELKKGLGESIGSAVKDGIAEIIKTQKAPGFVDEVNDEKKRSFREVLVAVKTGNKKLVDKYKLVPESKFFGDDADEKVLAEGAGATGGFLVPTEQSNQIQNLIQEKSIIRPISRVWPMSSLTLTVPTVTDGVTAYWIDENALKTLDDPVFAQMTLTAYKLCCLTIVSDELLADSNPKIDGVLFDLFAMAMVRGEETAFAQGAGVGGDPITGVYNTAGIHTVPSGGPLGLDDISELFNQVEDSEGEEISFLHAIRELGQLREMKDDNGQYVYQKPAAVGLPSTVWNYPSFKNKYIPRNLGAGANESYALAGDFRYAHIGDREGITIASDNGGLFFKNDQTCFRAVKRVAFAISDPTKFGRLTGILPS